MSQINPSTRPGLGLSVRRALMGRCPNCGEGKLFSGYLKQVKACPVCGEEFGHIRSDDAAPWLTILIVGHIFVPLLLIVEENSSLSGWVSAVLWPTLGAAMCLAVLPFAKAAFIAIIWSTRAPGSER